MCSLPVISTSCCHVCPFMTHKVIYTFDNNIGIKYTVILRSYKTVYMYMVLLSSFKIFLYKAWWSERSETCSLHKNNTIVLDGIWMFIYWVLEAEQGVLPQVNFLLTHFREQGLPEAMPADPVSVCCLDLSRSLSHYFCFLLCCSSPSPWSSSSVLSFEGFNSKLVFLFRGILLQCMSSSLLFTQFKD